MVQSTWDDICVPFPVLVILIVEGGQELTVDARRVPASPTRPARHLRRLSYRLITYPMSFPANCVENYGREQGTSRE